MFNMAMHMYTQPTARLVLAPVLSVPTSRRAPTWTIPPAVIDLILPRLVSEGTARRVDEIPKATYMVV